MDDIHSPLTVRRPAKHLLTIIMVIAAVAVGIFVGGFKQRMDDQKILAATTAEGALITVATVALESLRDTEKLILPGSLQAYYSAPIYARVSGYLKSWKLDIGADVKAGQILAEIETPDLDQQLKQAVANMESAKANAKLAETTAHRWRNLLKTDSVSVQEVDEKNGDYAAKKAFVMAAQANVDRLLALESFKRITAPFDGVITSRHTDIGALINAGHQSGKELFTISDVHKLRLYVTLPQNYAARIKPDMVVQVDVPEYPGKHFSAKLLGTSESVNESSGAMLMQFEVDNSSHELLPGEYGSVTFIFPANEKSLQIPASAILYKKEGPFIAVVAGNKRVMFKRVEILKDLGTSLDIAAILNANEMVINNPPESLMEGDLVKLKMSHSAEKKTTAPSIIPNTASKTKSQS